VFNLTVHINNTGNDDKACIGRFSTASVSYGDAFLARGSVLEFCAGKDKESERNTTAWGQDVWWCRDSCKNAAAPPPERAAGFPRDRKDDDGVASRLLSRAGQGGCGCPYPVGEARRMGRSPAAAGGVGLDLVVLCPDLGLRGVSSVFRRDGDRWPGGCSGGHEGRWRRGDRLTAALWLATGARWRWMAAGLRLGGLAGQRRPCWGVHYRPCMLS
jgi:hypothetical protein